MCRQTFVRCPYHRWKTAMLTNTVRTGIYFHGNLNGNFSVIVFNAFVAILTGSKPENGCREGQRERESVLTIIVVRQWNRSFLILCQTAFAGRGDVHRWLFLLLDVVLQSKTRAIEIVLSTRLPSTDENERKRASAIDRDFATTADSRSVEVSHVENRHGVLGSSRDAAKQ